MSVTNQEHIVHVMCGDPKDCLTHFFHWEVEEILLEECSDLVFEQHNWLKIQNKEVFFSHRIKALIPDLSRFTPKKRSSLLPRPLDSASTFSGYQGQLMSRDEFLFAFGMEGYDFLMTHYNFPDFGCFTIKEDYFVDRYCTYVGDWGSFPHCSSYHLPVCRLHTEPDYFKNGLYWASTQQDLLLLLENNLILEGLSPESSLIYGFLLEMYQKNPALFSMDEWDSLCFHVDRCEDWFLEEITPKMEEVQLKLAQLRVFPENQRTSPSLPTQLCKKIQ